MGRDDDEEKEVGVAFQIQERSTFVFSKVLISAFFYFFPHVTYLWLETMATTRR
jgi:hypothetical protein